MLNEAFTYSALGVRLLGMKTNTFTLHVNCIGDRVTFETREIGGAPVALTITSARKGTLCDWPNSYASRSKVAEYIATLPADAQLDTLEHIRALARLLCPDAVSQKETLAVYPNTVVRI